MKRTQPWRIARRIVQVGLFVLFAIPLFVEAFPLSGSLASSSIAGFSLLDPYAALELIATSHSIEASWLVAGGSVLALYAVLGGRVFCGWVCPVNLLLEITDHIRRSLGIRVKERAIPRHTKLVVAVVFLLLAALMARPVFEHLSPIAALSRGILFGSLMGVFVLIAIVIAELFWARRVWCRALCPVGALYGLIGRLGPLKVRIDHEACTACRRCQHDCLAAPEILDPVIEATAECVRSGDCMRCGACVDACPEQALRIGLPRDRDTDTDTDTDAARPTAP